MRVFLCHSSEDSAIAAALVDLLRDVLLLHAQDIRCTSVDGYRLPGGANVDLLIREEVLQVEVLVALLSPISIQSTYVMFELGARWGVKKTLIPVLAGGFLASSLKSPLSSINAINGAEPGQVHQLISDIAKNLNIRPEPPEVYGRVLNQFVQLCAKAQTIAEIPAQDALMTKYSDADCILLINHWLKELQNNVLNRPIKFTEIDKAVGISLGTAERLLNQWVSPPYQVQQRSHNIVVLGYMPSIFGDGGLPRRR